MHMGQVDAFADVKQEQAPNATAQLQFNVHKQPSRCPGYRLRFVGPDGETYEVCLTNQLTANTGVEPESNRRSELSRLLRPRVCANEGSDDLVAAGSRVVHGLGKIREGTWSRSVHTVTFEF